MAATILFVSMMGLILIGLPVAFAIGGSGVIYLAATHLKDFTLIPQQMFLGMDNFVLLAIPLFTFAGYLMEQGGISKRLIDWATCLLGRVPGSMGAVAIVCCAIFAALTGSGPATVAGIGSIMIPAMVTEGYDRKSAAGLVAGGGALGPIIPPSIPMIVYGSAMGVSVPMLFVGGILPGVALAVVFLLVNTFFALRNGIKGTGEGFSLKRFGLATWHALGALLLPVIILGGIYGGIFTPTEAAAVATAYALILGFAYKELTLKVVLEAAKKTVVTASMIMLIVGVSNIFVWLLAATRIPSMIVSAVTPHMSSPAVYMLMLMAILFVAGAMMDAGPAILILAPILSPIGVAMGIDPLFIGICFVTCLVIGYVTPPYGLNLFTAASTAGIPYSQVVRGTLPYMAIGMIFVVLMSLCPDVILWLPRLAGYGT